MKKKFKILAIFIAIVSFTACSEDEDNPSQENILTFAVSGADISIVDREVTISLPFGTDTSALKATIEVSEGATINPASGVAVSYYEGMSNVFTVTSIDGVSRTYNVRVNILGESASGAKLTSWSVSYSNSSNDDMSLIYEYGENGFVSKQKSITGGSIKETKFIYDSKNRIDTTMTTSLVIALNL